MGRVYNVVVKKRQHDNISYGSLLAAFTNLKAALVEDSISKVAIPVTGLRIDKLK